MTKVELECCFVVAFRRLKWLKIGFSAEEHAPIDLNRIFNANKQGLMWTPGELKE